MYNFEAKVLDDLPPMTASSTRPLFSWKGGDLCVGYLLSDDGAYAVVRFHGVTSHCFVYPNYMGLQAHQLWGRSLEFSRFHEVDPSARGVCSPTRHFLVTFHDNTLEIYAAEYSVVARTVEATSVEEAMNIILGAGEPRRRKPHCECFNMRGSKHSVLPVLHSEDQDTTTPGWARVLENIDAVGRGGSPKLEPLAGLTGE